MRINKYLAEAGVTSRRGADRLVADGEVTVNGVVVTEPGIRVFSGDAVTVKGRPIRAGNGKICLVMNKPRDCVTTMRDPQGRSTVREYLTGLDTRVFPVGRLDIDVGGVLLFTNDGDLANHLTHPRYGVEKTYHVSVRGIPTSGAINILRNGVELEEGKTAPAKIKVLKTHHRKNISLIEMTLHQGWKRQVKRMCRAVGYPVTSLERIRFAFIELGDLAPGQYRLLGKDEISRLKYLAERINK